jgi:PAS domain S-box/PAS domain S-box/PAS domain S-box/PAS domain S-box
MKNDKKMERELIAKLESAYQKVYAIEAQLKERGHREGNETERCQTMSDVCDSEIRYRRLFETAQDGILILDADSGAITDANPFIREILGYSPQDLIGKRLWEIGAFFDAVASKAAFEELQRKKYIRYENLPLQTKDGQLREVEFISNVYLVDLKKVIQCNIRNITKRKETEKVLKESEIRYRRLFEAAQDGILILDAESGAITDANPFITESLGYSLQDLIGKRLWEIGAFVDVKDSKAAFEELQRKKFIRYEDLPLKTKDGQSRQVEFVSNVYLVNGKKVIQCNIRDITERKRAVETLRESEERYRRLFETAQDGILLLDAESGAITDANPFLTKMLGYAPEDLIGKRLWEVSAFFDRVANKSAFEELQQKGYIRYDDLPLETKQGKQKQVEFVSNVYLVNGKKVIQCNIRDITERKVAEVYLQESEERYRRLVEFSPDAVMVHSCGKIVYVNPAAIRLLGAHDASELLSKSVFDIVHPDYKESVRLRVTTGIIENKTLPLMKEKFLRLDGVAIDVEVAALPIEYDGIPAMQDVIRDITEQQKLQQELLQSQKMQSIGTIAGGIAHDFNNILAIILGYTSLIEKNKLNARKQSESIAAIHQAVQRGTALVRHILTFARKTDISFEQLNLADLLQELFSMLQQTFPKIITFKKIFPKDIPVILADRTQIHQAVLNLCVNARDAMPNGGSIIIQVEKQTGKRLKEQFPTADQNLYVCISVTDTGEGMNEATRCRVFDPFFTTKTKGKGTGLGLSVVYGIVQAHRGFINVESELGHGTTFRLYFPIPNISEKPVDSQQAESFEIGGTETILLVEDEKLLLEMVRFLLESKGYKVFVAQDGAEAIEVYKKHRQEIALVFTDMDLPMMTGIEEFKKLKEIDPSVKVILASGFFEPDVKAEILKTGAKGILKKPYMSDEILRTLRNVLDKKNI